MIVSNTSPIIHLGKQGKLNLLEKCFQKILIPSAVVKEIYSKKETSECISLKKAISEGWIIETKVKLDKLVKSSNLGQGEKEAIMLAKKNKCNLLTDDKDARILASIVGVNAHGVLYVILLSVLKKFINRNAAILLIDRMMQEALYLTTELYNKIKEEIISTR